MPLSRNKIWFILIYTKIGYLSTLKVTLLNERVTPHLKYVIFQNIQFIHFKVVLVGNNRIELEHIPWQISDDGKYKVRIILKFISS